MTPGEGTRAVSTGYCRSVARAGALVVAHLLTSPADVELNHERHAEGPTLYRAVAADFPEIERIRLTSLMWSEAVDLAVSTPLQGKALLSMSAYEATLESVIDSVSGQALRDALAAPVEAWPAFLDEHKRAIESEVKALVVQLDDVAVRSLAVAALVRLVTARTAELLAQAKRGDESLN